MTDHDTWRGHLKPLAWFVQTERLPWFLKELCSYDDGGSWRKPFCDHSTIQIKDCGHRWLVVAMCSSYPFVERLLDECADGRASA